MTTILERPDYNIKIYDKERLFEVNITNDKEYAEYGFQEFLDYFKNTWELLGNTEDAYFLLINIHTNTSKNDLPLGAFIKLIQVLIELHNIFKTNLHSGAVLSKGVKKWQDAYNLITKLYKHPDQREFIFSESKDEITKFFNLNQLIK